MDVMVPRAGPWGQGSRDARAVGTSISVGPLITTVYGRYQRLQKLA